MSAVRIALVLAAWPGHAFALTVALNLIYSFPLHRKLQRGGRLLVGLLVFAFPGVLWWSFPPILDWYLYLCCFISLIVMPILTIRRLNRKPPVELVASSSRVFDVAKAVGAPLYGFGKHWRLAHLPGNQVFEVEFTERTLKLPRLPAAWDGLTILHVSDLHFHGTPTKEFFHYVLDTVVADGVPDIVCITGDYVDTIQHHAWIKPMLKRLQWKEGGFAILGNHDYWCAPESVRKQVARSGFIVPGNGWHVATIRGEPLVVISHEGPWFRPAPDLRDCPEGPFRLCLSHTPDNIGWAQRNGVDLMLSGHVHGGQIRLPIFGPIFVPSRYSRKYDGGCYKNGATTLYVSRGLSGREPLRWNCRPEITRLRLVR